MFKNKELDAILEREPFGFYLVDAASISPLDALKRKLFAYPALSSKEQDILLTAHKAGLRIKQNGQKTKFTKDELEILRNGERALSMIIGSNFKLLYSICDDLIKERYGISSAYYSLLPDMIGLAQELLIELAGKFNQNSGTSFGAYVGAAVKNKVRAAILEEAGIKIPPAWGRVKRIASARIPNLADSLGRTPTEAEIQNDLMGYAMAWAYEHLTLEQQAYAPEVREALMIAKLKKSGMLGAIKNIKDILGRTQAIASLDKELRDADSISLKDSIAYPTSSELDTVDRGDLASLLSQALATFPDRDREIILYRFGFVDGELWNYGELASKYGISAERIRQIEHAALAKLGSSSSYSAALLNFFIQDR